MYFCCCFFNDRGMKEEMGLLYLLRFIYKELLRTFQGYHMLSQNAFTENTYDKELEGKMTSYDVSLPEALS